MQDQLKGATAIADGIVGVPGSRFEDQPNVDPAGANNQRPPNEPDPHPAFTRPASAESRTPNARAPPNIDRFMREAEVAHVTGLSRTTRWRMEREGKFPARRRIGDNSVAWLESEIEAWMAEKIGRKNANPIEAN